VGSTYTLRWIQNSIGPNKCIAAFGQDFNWRSNCETNWGISIWPDQNFGGFPNLRSFVLVPYPRSPDAGFSVAISQNGKVSVVDSYSVGSLGHPFAITIEALDGSKWASQWFEFK
jgi:hypothetical protein